MDFIFLNLLHLINNYLIYNAWSHFSNSCKKWERPLPIVLDELKDYDLKVIIVLEENDKETIESTQKYNCKLVYQENKGYGDALFVE